MKIRISAKFSRFNFCEEALSNTIIGIILND